ncbi:MAG: ABC transporter permease [Candidatus Undinarchaeales archaeon]
MIDKIYTIWLREVIRFFRQKSRVIGSLGMPFFFLAILGSGIGSSFQIQNFEGNYMTYIMPGILGMVLLFGSLFAGISVIWDKQFGFMKEILVSPASRISIMAGKVLGGATTAITQALLMLGISLLIGVRINSIYGLLLSLVFMFLISFSFVSLGVAFASKMEDMHGFQLIMNFLIMPIFLLSGALFPINGLPNSIKWITYLDPLTYGVEGLRYSLLGISHIPAWKCLVVLLGFSFSTLALGTYFFKKMQI